MQQTKGKRSSESGFRPHVWGSFFMSALVALINACAARFHPHVWGSFFIPRSRKSKVSSPIFVFVPMFGDLFLCYVGNIERTIELSFRPHVWGSFFIACQRRPIPWGSAERFAAGIGHGIHGALSSGIAVPIFSGLMGIGGDLMKRLHQILKVLRVLRCAKCMLNSRHSCDNKRILEPSSP